MKVPRLRKAFANEGSVLGQGVLREWSALCC